MEKKPQLDLIDVTLLSESNCWPLFFRSVFFYFESCTASMTPIELPPKIKIRHVSMQGRERGGGMGVGSVIYICIYLDLCLLQFHQIIALIMKLPSAVILGTVKADLSFFDFRLQWVKIMWLLSPQRNKSTPGGQGTKVSWVTGIRRVKWNQSWFSRWMANPYQGNELMSDYSLLFGLIFQEKDFNSVTPEIQSLTIKGILHFLNNIWYFLYQISVYLSQISRI